MPRLRLPPLPPAKTWSKHFPRKYLGSAGRLAEREYTNRYLLANRQLADRFARELNIRENEVIIDAFAGFGRLTRSLLSGGQPDPEEEKKVMEEWVQHRGQAIPRSSKSKIKMDEEFPSWIESLDSKSELYQPPPPPEEEGKRKVRKPALVTAMEPNADLIERGFGQNVVLPPGFQSWDVTLAVEAGAKDVKTKDDSALVPSPYEDRLAVCPIDPFTWESIPYVLAHPHVSAHLPKSTPSAEQGGANGMVVYDWKAPPPPITVVATMPNNTLGEQLVAQWVNSSIGAAEGRPSFIWRWGRVRLAMLVGRGVYDRLTAIPGETITCKMTILTHALFKVTPLPPYHHVPNVDKASIAVEACPMRRNQHSPQAEKAFEQSKAMDVERTVTYSHDFYPAPTQRGVGLEGKKSLHRPTLLGVMLEPRKDTLVKLAQKDEWDFVLRHLFVRQALDLASALPNLGFGAAILLKDIEGNGPFAGRPVSGKTVIRDLCVEDWARIVDVFANWPFKPANLLLEQDFSTDDKTEPFD